MRRIGLISDTHGLLRPRALAALQGCDPIIHAGDVGDPAVLTALGELAELFAIRGNVDGGPWATRLPPTESLDIDGHLIHVLHAIEDLDIDPAEAGFDAVIYGHSHQPSVETKSGVLYVNPGSAGPRRFNLPITVATLTLQDGELRPRIIDIAG
jgi:putative phosphoesterase